MQREKVAREEERQRLDEQASRQREREQEAEARIAAKRAERLGGGQDMSARTFSRDRPAPAQQSSAEALPPAGRGPLRLQARGGGTATPSWREREAMRKAGGGDAEAERPTSSGRGSIPPRDRDSGRDYERNSSRDTRRDGGRDSREPGRTGGREMFRTGSGRGAAPSSERETSIPAAAAGGGTDGKYRPGMFKSMRGRGA